MSTLRNTDKPCTFCRLDPQDTGGEPTTEEYEEGEGKEKTKWLKCLNCGHTNTEEIWNGD